ncbi:hypothetical protein J3R83DRAFT_7718 [Lanmaoa asiatica]|nr:hypothetical protein J3R83DRAFT_8888 [Lanmaoa asiatica]KAH0825805.1 hypothetical protein J3R83DRAFT_8799 [Lanmaoa asiatica]KAH0825900.1 hypothetical protein J3R83DRAFT_7718 [Lanmaoa asiatica]
MVDEFGDEVNVHDEKVVWVKCCDLDLKGCCLSKLESLGDATMMTGQHSDTVSHYFATLTLHPSAPQGLFIKRSKVSITGGSWREALEDVNKHQVIELNPLSPRDYKKEHAALHKAGNYDDAIHAYEMMLSKMSQSPDLDICGECQSHAESHLFILPSRAPTPLPPDLNLDRLTRAC